MKLQIAINVTRNTDTRNYTKDDVKHEVTLTLTTSRPAKEEEDNEDYDDKYFIEEIDAFYAKQKPYFAHDIMKSIAGEFYSAEFELVEKHHLLKWNKVLPATRAEIEANSIEHWRFLMEGYIYNVHHNGDFEPSTQVFHLQTLEWGRIENADGQSAYQFIIKGHLI